MSRVPSFERLGAELERAAARQIAASQPSSARRRRGRAVMLGTLAAGVVVGAGAWAASALLSSGSPVPFERGAPIAGRAEGAPIPGTIKLLVDDIADPGGGPPWGLRYWETDRKFACLQVGRVYEGRLGQISAGKIFHELRVGVTRGALGGCFVLDGSGHAFAAIHTDAQRGAQPQPCPSGVRVGTRLRLPGGRATRCSTPPRTVDFGLLGPDATSLTYRAAGQDHTATPLGAVGAYLVVQEHVKPVTREYGFHHRDPKLNIRGTAEPYLALTPASQVIRRVTYTSATCTVRITQSLYGACNAQAGFVPIPQPNVTDVRTSIRAFAAPSGRGIRVRFRARQAVIDGRSGYDIEVRPIGAHGYTTQTYARNIKAGGQVRTTVDLHNRWRGRYQIVVRYRTIRPRPGPYARPAYPGLLVGRTRVTVP